MSDLRTRPKANFIQETNWQELYVLTNHWKSDLFFYRDDLRFMHHLIDKYFIWITKKENLTDVQKIGTAILEDEKACGLLIGKVEKHLSHLAKLVEQPLNSNAGKFRDEHQELEDDITIFTKTVRSKRKQLFEITERVLDDEQLAQLMEK